MVLGAARGRGAIGAVDPKIGLKQLAGVSLQSDGVVLCEREFVAESRMLDSRWLRMSKDWLSPLMRALRRAFGACWAMRIRTVILGH